MNLSSSGVYAIVNKTNGKTYVGSTDLFTRRQKRHLIALEKGKHHSRHLQATWNKYGPSQFEFVRLLVCSRENLLFYEQRAIDRLRPEYNILSTAGNSLGLKHTAESRAKMSAAHKGCRPSQETRKRQSQAGIGRRATAETRLKLSAAQMGNSKALGVSRSQEFKDKLRAANLGKKLSDQTKAKMSAANKGKKWFLGKKHSEESKALMSKLKLGRKFTAETLAKMAAGQQRRRARDRAIAGQVAAA